MQLYAETAFTLVHESWVADFEAIWGAGLLIWQFGIERDGVQFRQGKDSGRKV
jgi:hypothetical protein